MKATQMFKTLGLIGLVSLAAGGFARAADHRPGAPGKPPMVAHYNHYDHSRHDYRPGSHRHDRGSHRSPGHYGQVEQRQDRQVDRIQLGVARGEITSREAAKLYREQREIDRMQRDFLRDGHLTRWEYSTLDQALDNASRNIRHQARDNEWRW